VAIRPYVIDVPDAVLADLRDRLQRTRWPEPIPDTDWDYGANIAVVREICDYWLTEYDWRKAEASLNRHPGFLCEVDGLDLHFWHRRAARQPVQPLLLLHGWPGSIVEFDQLIEPLTNPSGDEPAFDVIVPSLPGFGFGGKPRERGWGPSRIADAFNRVMVEELGYEKYGVQGGDWGSIVGSRIASRHPERVAGLHLNFFPSPPPENPSKADKEAIERRAAFQALETGYSAVQGTKPDSLTLAQTDSPAGLAAWILEKFRGWSDCDGDLLSAFDRDTLLTNIMFYWAPNSIASAARIYYESRRDPAPTARIEVPTGIAAYPREPWRVPRHWVEPRYDITCFTEMERGGHFAALEDPENLLREIRNFFASFGSSGER
jgi:microsomal epoxide hydrolase